MTQQEMQMLTVLQERCAGCMACELHQGRTKSVFGRGNPNAPLMFVGEGPGQQEDLTGLPFVGRAGMLLDKFLAGVGLEGDSYYIANIVKCRPPENRDPLPEEQDQCIAFLREQFRLIRPRIVVCLGRIAAQRLISPDFKVTQMHGEWFKAADSGISGWLDGWDDGEKGVRLMGTFHPAALLRNPNQKPDAFSDFIKIRDTLKD